MWHEEACVGYTWGAILWHTAAGFGPEFPHQYPGCKLLKHECVLNIYKGYHLVGGSKISDRGETYF